GPASWPLVAPVELGHAHPILEGQFDAVPNAGELLLTRVDHEHSPECLAGQPPDLVWGAPVSQEDAQVPPLHQLEHGHQPGEPGPDDDDVKLSIHVVHGGRGKLADSVHRVLASEKCERRRSTRIRSSRWGPRTSGSRRRGSPCAWAPVTASTPSSASDSAKPRWTRCWRRSEACCAGVAGRARNGRWAVPPLRRTWPRCYSNEASSGIRSPRRWRSS